MTVINGIDLLQAAPLADMVPHKVRVHGVSHGLSEVGYDLRIKQRVVYHPPSVRNFVENLFIKLPFSGALASTVNYKDLDFMECMFHGYTEVFHGDGTSTRTSGRTALASSVERFQVPENLWGELRNKSSWARLFVDAALGTDVEPGWNGYLTIEIVFNSNKKVEIEAGSGILKAVFHQLSQPASYGSGKYQNQPDEPVPARFE